ncbi:MAG: hypothetical protein P0Y59_18035 [Candidatus Sphingomonas phytovorans]|nr:hypothetical protein [Sphingomonas sp.]WEJ98823.1 MAG: hypothetical protein P0Y59_18035 [Sphingomonas sp.]
MAVDRELRLPVQDDEHLFAIVVEMFADAASGRDHAAVDEDQVGAERIGAEDWGEFHGSGAGMNALAVAVSGRVGMADALRQRLRRPGAGLNRTSGLSMRGRRNEHRPDDRARQQMLPQPGSPLDVTAVRYRSGTDVVLCFDGC